MRLIIIAILLAVTFTGCQSPARAPRVLTDPPRDGLSFQTAYVIEAPDQHQGLAVEYASLNRLFPGWRRTEGVRTEGEDMVVKFGHATMSDGGRLFSVHDITLADGTDRMVYYDITSYFGK